MKKSFNVVDINGHILAQGVSNAKANRIQNNAKCETILKTQKQ